ncbi:transcription initiation factor TFIID subunit 3 isoform X2 [Nilaparvata lugens]|uniref:transcription initiation factor TFIID subunit 3 isoform X2 n=1 Tax=Nilaparvata lugens TaxID=108931 RepID=UPI00193CF384|nr:transcription initiation factor TFIID subunit 3 isoform X2 [Nilaparvata lugens]
MGITTDDLSEYVEYVATIPSQREVPKYPVERESHLNLLKPGSQEVVTRPVHIHEHLPAMHPELEDEDYGVKAAALTVDTTIAESDSPPLSSPKANPFKKPGDPVSLESPQLKRVRSTLEEEGRPLREISSVMMTTSGFLSPAREGKLPEARTPTPSVDFLAAQSSTSSPQTSFGPSSYPTVPPEVKGEKKIKKKPFIEPVRKVDEPKEKDHLPDSINDDDDSKVKKLVGMKELSKLKALKSLKIMSQHSNPNITSNTLKHLPKIPKFRQNNPTSGANPVLSMTSKIKKFSNTGSGFVKMHHDGPSSVISQQKFNPFEKIKSNTSISSSSSTSMNIDGKLTTEPDRQKLNIFKKISKVKEDKFVDHSEKFESKDSRESISMAGRMSSISEVIESVVQRSMKESLEPSPFTPVASHSDNVYSDNDTFMYDSPPGTPRTPEVIMPSLKKSETKKRKRDKGKDRKEKFMNFPPSPKMKCEPLETEIIEKPKTPEIETVHDNIPILPTPSPVFPYFPSFPPAPGLIPPPISGLFPPRFNLDKHGALIPQHITPPHLPPRPEPKPFPPPLKKHYVPPPPPKPLTPPSPPPAPPRPLTPPPPPLPTTPTLLPPVLAAPAPIPHAKTEIVEKPVVVKEKEKVKEEKEKVREEKEKVKEEKKKDKEHRKDKKDKIKKKKDKKDKIKNKDKSLKKKEKLRKEKAREKKERRREEKRREKEREQSAQSTASEKPAVDVTPSVSNANVPKITLKLGPQSPQPFPSETPHRKIVIKPVKKPEEMEKEEKKEVERPREPSPELARISALVTTRPTKPTKQKAPPSSSPSASKASKANIHHPPAPSTAAESTKPKEPKKPAQDPVQEPLPYYYDDEGTQVWICPACGGQDDGSPMIGCDGCDAWYHWVCVGIQVPPESNDWFCRVCICKKDVTSEKKKKIRKKKM